MQMWLWVENISLNLLSIFINDFSLFDCLVGYPAYTGTLCETLVCQNEPAQCKDQTIYTASNCASSTALQFYCPVLCNICQATTTTVTPKPCSLTCNNGGKLNTISCACECNK